MGHRANFIVVRDGHATAYYHQWAAKGCIHTFADGPEAACKSGGRVLEPTNALMDWCNAEGGYLIDFDQKTAIVFGHEMDCDLVENGDGTIDEEFRRKTLPFIEGGLSYLQYIATKWRGWTLAWENGRGVDAFAAHLRGRSIKDIALQPDSHPVKTSAGIVFQA